MRFIACRRRLASPTRPFNIVFGVVFLQFLRLFQQFVVVLRLPVADDTGKGVAIELQREVLDLGLTAAATGSGEVFPAVLIERRGDLGRAHYQFDLALGHAGFELIDHLLVDDIALADVHLVDEAASRQQHSGEKQGREAHRGSDPVGKDRDHTGKAAANPNRA
jgi:hypothetical protein